MLSALALKRAQPGKGGYQETRNGLMICSGTVRDFHTWKVRTVTKLEGCADEKARIRLGSEVLDGLRDHAFNIAMKIGSDRICSDDGVGHLVHKIHQGLFPKYHTDHRSKPFYHPASS